MERSQSLNCHCNSLSIFFIAAKNRNSHPPIKARPPTGVIMPALSRAVTSAALPAVSTYNEPEKRIIPSKKSIPAILANFGEVFFINKSRKQQTKGMIHLILHTGLKCLNSFSRNYFLQAMSPECPKRHSNCRQYRS
jgi:hypothetical protein